MTIKVIIKPVKKPRFTRITYDFFIKNSTLFNVKMAVLLFAKLKQGNNLAVSEKFVEFNLEELAVLLDYSIRHLMLGYKSCLEDKWLTELERTGWWVKVDINVG